MFFANCILNLTSVWIDVLCCNKICVMLVCFCGCVNLNAYEAVFFLSFYFDICCVFMLFSKTFNSFFKTSRSLLSYDFGIRCNAQKPFV